MASTQPEESFFFFILDAAQGAATDAAPHTNLPLASMGSFEPGRDATAEITRSVQGEGQMGERRKMDAWYKKGNREMLSSYTDGIYCWKENKKREIEPEFGSYNQRHVRQRVILFAFCDKCKKCRRFEATLNAAEGFSRGEFSCEDNLDPDHNTCQAPEEYSQEEVDEEIANSV